MDEIRSLRDSLFKVLTGKSAGREIDDEDESSPDDDGDGGGGGSLLDARAAKALLGALFARAGKSKDDVVQVLAREIGVAIAAMLKEPLGELAKHHKLTISFELVPKAGVKVEAEMEPTTGGKPARGAPRREKPYSRSGGRAPKRSAPRRKADKSGA